MLFGDTITDAMLIKYRQTAAHIERASSFKSLPTVVFHHVAGYATVEQAANIRQVLARRLIIAV
jgi:hypothetical protein